MADAASDGGSPTRGARGEGGDEENRWDAPTGRLTRGEIPINSCRAVQRVAGL